MNYRETFYAALLALLHTYGETQAVQVTDFEEETYQYGGGCDTCTYTETVVEIFYDDAEGKSHKYKHSGSFVSLVRELTEEPEVQ
jgi:hypothetical protein